MLPAVVARYVAGGVVERCVFRGFVDDVMFSYMDPTVACRYRRSVSTTTCTD